MKIQPVIRGNCGSTRGYQKHWREGEESCEACLAANRAYRDERMKNPKNVKRKSEQSRKYRQANLDEYRRKEAISREKRIDKKNARAKDYHAENREKRNKYSREYKKAHPELLREQRTAYYQRNKEAKAAYRAANREKAKAWRDANPELFRIYNHKRKARKRAVASEPYTTEQILALYGTDCHICKEPIDLGAPRTANQKGYERGLHLDHIIPLAKGGSDLMSNVGPSHAECNLKKHTTLAI